MTLPIAPILSYLPVFLLAFALSFFATPIVRRIALHQGLIAYPRSDRWHKQPTALMGGTSIFLATLGTILFFRLFSPPMTGLLLGGTFLFLAGLADDKIHLTPYTKLFFQIAAGCIAVLFGTTLPLPLHSMLTVPLTLLWIVGVTNSFNLLDNIDGLAAGIATISSLMLFFTSLVLSQNPFSIFALILAAAALGFLPYNFNPARIFMGDSGSMFLGFSLAVISISGSGRHLSSLSLTMLIPVLILSVPIFDTLFVMIVRTLNGRRIFDGGKDHTSHRLVTLGLSQRKTVLLLYAVSVAFGLIAILYTARFNLFVISAVAFLSATVLLFFGIFLFDVTSFPDEKSVRRKQRMMADATILNNILMHKRRFVEVLLDLSFIFIAYYASYFLRFEGVALRTNLVLMRESLLWVILIKLSVFFIFGMYRGMWRYISVSDLLTIFKVVSIGSVSSIIFVTFLYRFQDYSRKVFFIDWILLLFLTLGSRIIIRVMGEFFSGSKKGNTKVLIFGAGDTGEMLVREIKRNAALCYSPVGFIDDDPTKIGTKIQGVAVLGNRERLDQIVRERGIQLLLVAAPDIGTEEFQELSAYCKEKGIALKKIKGLLDD